ncbi:MAG: hypothetical protein KME31_12510 [Tolypothrix carrinoi HA7290-LM1]|uniref:Uncharacterized protein n=1 Tax=Scytonema hofmannii FACHB-248 TaxID=1842502 RepID=A0ABR8GL02_9CYAN|nr:MULTISPECIES: hypothetical protein [Nostocales]MBD2603835.1 hypothetical protein [Scytonema hofmannii FACHB-248]MBW4568808.1 hypothetical protein [Tolypothrix carrinoi HA7290-LM1]
MMPKRVTKPKLSTFEHQTTINILPIPMSSEEKLDSETMVIINQIEAEWDYKHSCGRW